MQYIYIYIYNNKILKYINCKACSALFYTIPYIYINKKQISLPLCVFVSYVCSVCVCVRARERDRQTDRQWHRETDTHTERRMNQLYEGGGSSFFFPFFFLFFFGSCLTLSWEAFRDLAILRNNTCRLHWCSHQAHKFANIKLTITPNKTNPWLPNRRCSDVSVRRSIPRVTY